MRRSVSVFVITLLSVQMPAQAGSASASKGKPEKTSVKDILDKPARFDKKLVQVEGVVGELKLKTSKRGNDYTTFRVSDEGKRTLAVYSYGHLKISDGDRVRVTGSFAEVKQVGEVKYRNEIDANDGKVERLGKTPDK